MEKQTPYTGRCCSLVPLVSEKQKMIKKKKLIKDWLEKSKHAITQNIQLVFSNINGRCGLIYSKFILFSSWG